MAILLAVVHQRMRPAEIVCHIVARSVVKKRLSKREARLCFLAGADGGTADEDQAEAAGACSTAAADTLDFLFMGGWLGLELTLLVPRNNHLRCMASFGEGWLRIGRWCLALLNIRQTPASASPAPSSPRGEGEEVSLRMRCLFELLRKLLDWCELDAELGSDHLS